MVAVTVEPPCLKWAGPPIATMLTTPQSAEIAAALRAAVVSVAVNGQRHHIVVAHEPRRARPLAPDSGHRGLLRSDTQGAVLRLLHQKAGGRRQARFGPLGRPKRPECRGPPV